MRTTLLALAIPLLAAGCLSQRFHTDSARSATEQLLIAGAAEKAAAEVEVPPVSEREVSLEVVGLGPGQEFYVDLLYLRAALEHRLLEEGAVLVEPAEAALRLTARVAALGTVSRQFTLGVPRLRIELYQNAKHRGYARLRLVAVDRDGALVAESEPVMTRTRHDFRQFMQIIWRQQDIYPEDRSLGLD